MAHIVITAHALEKTEQRTRFRGKMAEMFLINIFKKLSDRSRENKTNKGRKVVYKYEGSSRYQITDGKHKIIFVKDRSANEIIILTYINSEEKDYNDNLKQVMYDLGILGTTI